MVALLVLQTPARAQDHTFVSGAGDDINPCSRSMACRTFAGAIGKTAAGGTISVLDSAGYGSVIISKSITQRQRRERGGRLGHFDRRNADEDSRGSHGALR